jgi:hypothetical protein
LEKVVLDLLVALFVVSGLCVGFGAFFVVPFWVVLFWVVPVWVVVVVVPIWLPLLWLLPPCHL